MLKGGFLAISLILLAGCGIRKNPESGFIFHEDSNGLELTENGDKVLYYQKAPVLAGPDQVLQKETRFMHYIHPLYNLDGMAITEAQPDQDPWHPHHRGIFWAWHQLYIEGESVGDSWTMEHLFFNLKELHHEVNENGAKIFITVHWITTMQGDSLPFVEEKTNISIQAKKDGRRMIDFEIGLRGLQAGVQIGGSKDNTKGYGGFSARIVLADSMLFLSENGPVKPLTGQVKAGWWVDFSTPELKPPHLYGLAIFCHPQNPKHPSAWLLRAEKSMQNPAYPGFELATLSASRETLLRYRLIVHEGTAGKQEIRSWFTQYANHKK